MRDESHRRSDRPEDDFDSVAQLKWVDHYTQILDTKFRIPGTGIRFGADFLLGLVPGVGDALSLMLSGILIATMAKHGASLRLVLRMLANVAIDAIVGVVPIFGNLFDLFHKANQRNLKLMREHYAEGKHRGSIWPILLCLVSILFLLLALFAWAMIGMFFWVSNRLTEVF